MASQILAQAGKNHKRQGAIQSGGLAQTAFAANVLSCVALEVLRNASGGVGQAVSMHGAATGSGACGFGVKARAGLRSSI